MSIILERYQHIIIKVYYLRNENEMQYHPLEADKMHINARNSIQNNVSD